jgi:hypothetical protein
MQLQYKNGIQYHLMTNFRTIEFINFGELYTEFIDVYSNFCEWYTNFAEVYSNFD